MRGALRNFTMVDVRDGIIPAYAGSTWLWCVAVVLAWDHPRVCGEHITVVRHRRLPSGSSPRMRGALSEFGRKIVGGRIIPAYAGSTACPHQAGGPSRDHPRVCGEHQQ